MVLTVHRWFANKSCPGDWLYARLGDLAAKVTAALGGAQASGLQASSLKNLSEAEAVAKIGPLVHGEPEAVRYPRLCVDGAVYSGIRLWYK